jgi:hypothetical protein
MNKNTILTFPKIIGNKSYHKYEEVNKVVYNNIINSIQVKVKYHYRYCPLTIIFFQVFSLHL